ncbi:restriction endonuclease subunit S [uncultured Cloacibacillus sp.]|uniref:restriction endonuclease subunit S n=1 Tax=uncultured Cloacibacillus sp. TaxID=889794 RepID=UPI0026DC543B|nr:restriction endonuclease subunit S [uncultured Cloacibacillus sp.]
MARLGDVATYINGYAFKPEDWSQTGLPIIRIQDLTGNSYQANRYDGEYEQKYEVNDGDVLISWSASLGVYVWHGEKAVLNQHIFKVVFDKAEISKSFFVHQVENILEMASSSTHGATMKHLTKPVFDALPFFLPSLDEQRKIAAVLDKISDLIAKRRRQLDQLDELVQSRFVEMFGDPLFNTKGWAQVAIKDACASILGGGTPSKSNHEYFTGTIPWVSPKDMKTSIIDDSIDHITEDAIANSTTNLVPQNSVLMVVRSGILKHTLPVAINRVPVAINQDMKAFIPNDRITAEYFMYYLKSIEQDILGNVRCVTADNIDFKAFQTRQISLPPLKLQQQFTSFLTCSNTFRFLVYNSLKKLELLKQALMQEYFGGLEKAI